MKLYYFVVGMLMASAFMAGTSMFIGESVIKSGVQVNSSYNTTFDKTNQMLELANQTSNEFKSTSILTSIFQPLQVSSWPTITLVFNSFSITHDMITSVFRDLGVAWIGDILLALVTIGLVFAVLAAIFYGRTV